LMHELSNAKPVTTFLRIRLHVEMRVEFGNELHCLSRIRAFFSNSDGHLTTSGPLAVCPFCYISCTDPVATVQMRAAEHNLLNHCALSSRTTNSRTSPIFRFTAKCTLAAVTHDGLIDRLSSNPFLPS